MANKTEAELRLDWAIERMNKSVDTAIVSILNGITKMVDSSVAETIKSLSPEAKAMNRDGNQHSEICSYCDHR